MWQVFPPRSVPEAVEVAVERTAHARFAVAGRRATLSGSSNPRGIGRSTLWLCRLACIWLRGARACASGTYLR